jgi:NIPSNAP protein
MFTRRKWSFRAAGGRATLSAMRAMRWAAIGLPLLSGNMSMTDTTTRPSWPVVELRQYTLHPGQRDVLIDLFEREFIESQEALGMRILGTFRDLDRPDRFVWIRGFRDMGSRAQGLAAFYDGPVWKAHRNAANATMIDSDNVLLLRAVAGGVDPADGPRPPPGATRIPETLVVATIYSFPTAVASDFVDSFERTVKPELQAAGCTVRATYVSETTPDNFPRLPVRENDHVFLWFSTFEEPQAYERCLSRLARSASWPGIEEELQRKLTGPPEVLRLQPTARSAFPSAGS